MGTIIGNVSLVVANTASEMRGRILGTRQTIVSPVKAGSILAFGRMTDLASAAAESGT